MGCMSVLPSVDEILHENIADHYANKSTVFEYTETVVLSMQFVDVVLRQTQTGSRKGSRTSPAPPDKREWFNPLWA